MGIFVDLFATLDSTLEVFRETAVDNLATYVTNFVKVAGVVTVILAGIELYWAGMRGIKKIFGTFFLIALVSQIATVPANYNEYIGNYLSALPDDLMQAVAPEEFNSTGGVGAYLDTTVDSILTGIQRIWSSASLNPMGPGVFGPIALATILFLLLLVMGAAAAISIIVGKVTIALVIGLGPLFVMCLVVPGLKDWFTKWLSYAFSMAILQLLIGSVMLLAKTILTQYVIVLTSTTAPIMNSPGAAMAPALVMLVLAYIFGQLPSMASSLGGGIGITTGNAAWSAVKGGAKAAGWQMGGRRISEHNEAAHARRVYESGQRQEARRKGDAGGGGGEVREGKSDPQADAATMRQDRASRRGNE